MKRVWAGLVLLVSMVAAVGTPAGAIEAKPPAACIRALDRADTIRSLSGEFSAAVSRYLGSHLEDELAATRQLGDDAERIANRMRATVRAYERAASTCRQS